MQRTLTLAILFLVTAHAAAADVHRELLPHSRDSSKKVELFWTEPPKEGRHPAILFIHGHQEQARNGGEALVKTGRLDIMARRGYVAASLSQPGYGHSDGPPDYCGPFTQEAVLVALDFLRKRPSVDPGKLVLYGYSRGAIAASMVATRVPDLAALVLGAGAYDFASLYPTGFGGIDANIRKEAGTSPAAFAARSALHHADKIRASVLLLHGARDPVIPARQAEAFAEKLKTHGVAVRLKIFPEAMHGIPIDEQYREIYPFLEERLR
jgi:dipeptidyl aminopeptidase/acylaminoacyl peptidase